MAFQCFDLYRAESAKIIASVFDTAGTSKNKWACRLEEVSLCAYLIRIVVLLLCRFQGQIRHTVNVTEVKQTKYILNTGWETVKATLQLSFDLF